MNEEDIQNTKLSDKVIQSQRDYYQALYAKHSYSPEAVGSEAQIIKELRYQRLSRLFGDEVSLSVHDIGMGLGHYYEYLKEQFPDKKLVYSGSEVVEEFFDYCTDRYPECSFYMRELSNKLPDETYDYVVCGGTFHHPHEMRRSEWEAFIFQLLRNGFQMARKGIVFNVVTQYCDYYDRQLYYCNTSKFLDFITDSLSRFFVIDHSYPLYEMTVCVYQEDYIKSQYPAQELQRYFG